MRIVLCYPVEDRHIDQIAAAAPGADIVGAGQERVAAEIIAADVFCGHPKVPMPWDEVVAGGRLKWIQSSAAGVDHCLMPSVIASDIPVTSASGVLSDQVAEHAVALITALCRSLSVFFDAQRRKDFTRRPTRDLHRSTIGIVGFGGVGRRLAEILSSFKTRILATDLFPIDKPDHVDQLWPAQRVGELAEEVDILILCCPLTEATTGMVNQTLLARMKPDALLINMARGPLVVEADLVAALAEGRLGGAALDVTEVEPLPSSSRLWEMPKVIITPHVAGQSTVRIDKMTDFFCENLRRFQSGEPLVNVVDKQLGFPIRQARQAQ